MKFITRVVISKHALDRYREYSGLRNVREWKLASIVRNHILPQLALGLVPDDYDALHVAIGDGLTAVVMASWYGGWEVVTVLRPGMDRLVPPDVERVSRGESGR